MKKEVQTLISRLGALTPTELTQVKAALEQHLIAVDTAPDETLPLFQAMTGLLGLRMSWGSFCKMTAYKVWRRQAPVALRFIEDNWPGQTKVTKLALMTFLLEMLIDYLKAGEIPVAVQTITNNLGKLPAAFDLAFPGYRQAGLMHLIVKQMKQRRSEQ